MPLNFAYNFYSSTQTAWQAMYQAILGAVRSVYWDIYIFVDDSVGAKFVDLLCLKARQGVDVKLIVDGLGSAALSETAKRRLRQAGAQLLVYHPLRPLISRSVWRRWLGRRCASATG